MIWWEGSLGGNQGCVCVCVCDCVCVFVCVRVHVWYGTGGVSICILKQSSICSFHRIEGLIAY